MVKKKYLSEIKVESFADLKHALKRAYIQPAEAWDLVFKQKFKVKRTSWKLVRFQLYLYHRYKAYKQRLPMRVRVQRIGKTKLNRLPMRIRSVEDTVFDKRYSYNFRKFQSGVRFDSSKEIKRLNQLIAEKRQDETFRSYPFLFEEDNKPMPKYLVELLR